MTSLDSFGSDVEDLEDEESADPSPAELAERHADVMAAAFQKTGLVEIAQVRAAIGQVHLLARVKEENEKRFVDDVVFPVLESTYGSCDDSFFGTQYFLSMQDGGTPTTSRRRYGWVLSFSSSNMEKTLRDVCGVLDRLAQRKELLEMPLVGQPAPQSGGRASGRKGASPVGG
jgi:hypothetical protein